MRTVTVFASGVHPLTRRRIARRLHAIWRVTRYLTAGSLFFAALIWLAAR